MRRVFLHAGQPKTGTTAIQLYCVENREALTRLGYLYPRAAAGVYKNHVQLVQSLLGRSTKRPAGNIVELVRQEIAADPSPNLIISSEYLFGRLGKASAEGVFEFLKGLGLHVTILLYIRPYLERVNSSYTQKVKAFKTTEDFDHFAMRQAERTEEHYARLIDLWSKFEMIFRPYNGAIRRSGIIDDFLSTIGISKEERAGLGPERRVNESVGPIAVCAARDIVLQMQEKGRIPSPGERKLLKKRLFEMISEKEPELAFCGVNTTLYQRIEDRILQSQDAFAQKVWGMTWDQAFPPQERKACNALDPTAADQKSLDAYERIRKELWSTALEIMVEPASTESPSKRRLKKQDRLAVRQRRQSQLRTS